MADSASYGQEGTVKYLHYGDMRLPAAVEKARSFRAAIEGLLTVPVAEFLDRRHAIGTLTAMRAWGRSTALAVPHPYRDGFLTIVPIIPGRVVVLGEQPGAPATPETTK